MRVETGPPMVATAHGDEHTGPRQQLHLKSGQRAFLIQSQWFLAGHHIKLFSHEVWSGPRSRGFRELGPECLQPA